MFRSLHSVLKRQPQAKPSFATLFHHSHEGDPWMSTLKMPWTTAGKWSTQQDILLRLNSRIHNLRYAPGVSEQESLNQDGETYKWGKISKDFVDKRRLIQLSQLPQLSGWKMTTSGSTKETCWFLRRFKRPSLHYHRCRLSENMWKLRSTKLGLIKVPEFLQQEMHDANVPPELQPLSLQVSRTHSPRVGLLLEIGLDIRDRTSKEQVQLLAKELTPLYPKRPRRIPPFLQIKQSTVKAMAIISGI